MANGDENQNNNQNNNNNQRRGAGDEPPDFSELTGSIIDSMGQMQDALEANTQRLLEMQEGASSTLFSSDFMSSLEDDLLRIANSSERIADKLENQVLGGSRGETTINVDSTAIANEIRNAFENVSIPAGGQMQIDYDELSTKLAQSLFLVFDDLGIGGQGGNQSGTRTRRRTRSRGRSSLSRFSSRFGGFGQNDITSLFQGQTDIREVFPEFINYLDLAATEQEFLTENVFRTQRALDALGDQADEVTSGSLSEIISKINEIQDTPEGARALRAMGNAFEEELGENAVSTLSRLQGMVDKSIENINNASLDPTTTNFTDMYESVRDSMRGIQSVVISGSQKMWESNEVETTESINAMFNSVDEIYDLYQKLENSGASRREIQESITNMMDIQRDEYSELRESSGDFAEQQDRIMKTMKENLESMSEMARIEEQRDRIYEKMTSTIDSLSDQWETWSARVKATFSLLTNPYFLGAAAFTGVVAALRSVYNQIFELDSAVNQVADSTGLITDRLNNVQDVIRNIQPELVARGAEMADIQGFVEAIYSEFGSVNTAAARLGMRGDTITEQMINTASTIGTIATSLNVSGQEAAGLLNTFQTITSTTGEALEAQVATAGQLIRQSDVAPQAAFQDIAAASEQIAKFGAVTGEEIAAAAVEARRLGSNLSEVLSVAENLRGDVTGSIQSLQRAELMLGQPINEARLLRASFQGPQEAAVALRETLSTLNLDLDSPLATIQLQSLGDALGISVQRIRAMAEAADATADQLSDLVAAGSAESINNVFEASQTQIAETQRLIEGLSTTFTNLIAGPILDIVNPALRSAADAVQDFALELRDQFEYIDGAPTLRQMASTIQDLGETSENVSPKMAGFGSSLLFALDKGVQFFMWTVENLPTAIDYMQNTVIPALTAFTNRVAKLGGMLSPVFDLLVNFADWITSGSFASIATKIGAVTIAIGALRFGLSKLMKWGSSLAGLGDKVSDTAGTVSKGTDTMGSALKSFGVQLALIAGSLYVASEAFENFNNVEWSSMRKGAVALGAMGAALYVFNRIIDGIKWQQLVAAGAVMAAFAGSLYLIGEAMEYFESVSASAIAAMAATVGVVTGLAGVLSLIIGGTGGAGALAGLAAGGLMLLFASSLYVVGKAMHMFGESTLMIVEAAERISMLENVDEIAVKILQLTEALEQLPGAGLSEFLAGLSGSSTADQLKALTDLAGTADGLDRVAVSINNIADAMRNLSEVDASAQIESINTLRTGEEGIMSSLQSFFGDIALDTITLGNADNVQMLIDRLEGQNNVTTQQQQGFDIEIPQAESGEASGEEEQTYKAEVLENDQQMIEKLQQIANMQSEMLAALKNGEIAVYLDGKEVTDQLLKQSERSNRRR